MYQYRKITEFGFRGMWRITQISEAVLSTSADNILLDPVNLHNSSSHTQPQS